MRQRVRCLSLNSIFYFVDAPHKRFEFYTYLVIFFWLCKCIIPLFGLTANIYASESNVVSITQEITSIFEYDALSNHYHHKMFFIFVL